MPVFITLDASMVGSPMGNRRKIASCMIKRDWTPMHGENAKRLEYAAR